MKKKIAAALAATFVLGVTSAFANNPFVDVPAKHWSYDSVNKLAKAGIVDGYGDGTFRGDKNMTRYEMAQIVAKAMTKLDKADAEQKAMINKLSAEYASELNNLGVRVGALESKVGNIKMVAETRLDYTWLDSKTNGSDDFSYRQRFHLTAPVTDKISYTARLQANGKFGSGDTAANTTKVTRNFITVKDMFGINSTMLGRQPLAIGRQMAFADTENNDGIAVKHAFGKATVDAFWMSVASKEDVKGINVNYAATKTAEFNVGYFAADKNDTNLTADTTFMNAGLSYGFGKGVTLVGDYVQSDAAGDPKAYAAQLVYNWKSGKVQKTFYGWEKMVNPSVAHDQGVSFSYFDVTSQSLPGYGEGNFKSFGAAKGISKDTGNVKGYMFAYQNMMAKNVMLDLNYTDAEAKTSGIKDKKIVAAVEFYY